MKPNAALVAIALLSGVALGVGSYTFLYAKGYSYFSNDPLACANCHVMRGHYDGWVKSSHHGAAQCNDCHTPTNPVMKYAVKASNGFFHSLAFTAGRFPDAIQIKSRNHEVIESACRNCHQDVVTAIEGAHRQARSTSCVRCHVSSGHSQALAWSPIADEKGNYR